MKPPFDIARLDAVGQVGGHQRREDPPRGQSADDPIAIGDRGGHRCHRSMALSRRCTCQSSGWRISKRVDDFALASRWGVMSSAIDNRVSSRPQAELRGRLDGDHDFVPPHEPERPRRIVLGERHQPVRAQMVGLHCGEEVFAFPINVVFPSQS
jgi:hypothetical protein